MALTMRHTSGDGVLEDLERLDLVFDDTADRVTVSGQVQRVGGELAAVGPVTLSAPAPPSAGHRLHWLVQVDRATGAVSEKQATDGPPPAADPDNLVLLELEIPAAAPAETEATGDATSA